MGVLGVSVIFSRRPVEVASRAETHPVSGPPGTRFKPFFNAVRHARGRPCIHRESLGSVSCRGSDQYPLMKSPEALVSTLPGSAFVSAIPLLPAPLREEVTLAYLLFRIADTLEDEGPRSPQERCGALKAFEELLLHPRAEVARQLSVDRAASFFTTETDRALLLETGDILAAVETLPPDVGAHIRTHVARTASGMARALMGMDATGHLSFTRSEELIDYCYDVSVVVGELLTELFVLEQPRLRPVAEALRERVTRFGEGIQLVNVLRDLDEDLRNGRSYMPPGTSWREWAARARWGLQGAAEYNSLLQEAGADPGVVAFTSMSVRLGLPLLAQMDMAGRPGVHLSQERIQALLESPDSSP